MAQRWRSAGAMSGQLRLTGGRRHKSPPGRGTRPTTARVREAVMNMLGSRLQSCRWLDLCSGSGIMGCEALLRGAATVVAVERNAKTAAVCSENLGIAVDSAQHPCGFEVIRQDLASCLRQGWTAPGFDLVYLDPPYASALVSLALTLLSEGTWLNPDALVICEHPSDATVEPPQGWTIKDRRRYGISGLTLLKPPGINPPVHHRGGTGSTPPRTDPAA